MNEMIGPYMLYMYILKHGYHVDYVGPDVEDYIVYLKKDLNWADNGTTGTAEATVRLTSHYTSNKYNIFVPHLTPAV